MFKLMIVDDEILMRIGIRSMIDWEAHGFHFVSEAANGKEALEKALELQPDLIMTDIKMPIVDGLQLIREASKTLDNCKFIVLSNFDEFRYVKEAFQLGAIDYLIKSEITPKGLTELLMGIRQKLNHDHRPESLSFPPDYTQSLNHLKENLFKDLISGLLDEQEASFKAQQLESRVSSSDLVVIKLRIDNFEEIRMKYVEQDEKLLRFSIVNILTEIIASKWNKEIVVESSSEYLLLVNTPDVNNIESIRLQIGKLCSSIGKTMKDFMNLSISAGISSIVPGFRLLKLAYQEADKALQRIFYEGPGAILFSVDACKQVSEQEIVSPIGNKTRELALMNAIESGNEAKLTLYFEQFRDDLASTVMNERKIRKAYIHLTEVISTSVPYANRPYLPKEDKLPYEAVLAADTWDNVHDIVLAYARQCCKAGDRSSELRSYADMAVEIIERYYAEDISLQSVASQINVNPSYLSRVFKQEKGENFVSFLTRVRLEQAKTFLKNRRYKVYEVAEKVGYHNHTYFSKIFKKAIGVCPEEYRDEQTLA